MVLMPGVRRWVLVVAVLHLLCRSGQGAVLCTGEVVGVTDGDTITVLCHQRSLTVRLDGNVAPELGQAGLLNRGVKRAIRPHLSPPSGTLADQEASMDSRDSLVSLARYLSDRINEMTASADVREEARRHVLAAMRKAKDNCQVFCKRPRGPTRSHSRSGDSNQRSAVRLTDSTGSSYPAG